MLKMLSALTATLLTIVPHLQAAPPVRGAPYLPDESEILLYASFDKSCEPELARGARECRILPSAHEADYAEGILGKAIVTGPVSCQYDADGNIGNAGALEMWLKPVDWDINSAVVAFFRWGSRRGVQDAYLSILNTVPSQRVLYFYVYNEVGTRRKLSSVQTSDRNWERNQWRHVVVNWKGQSLTIYLDGEKAGEGNIPGGLSLDERGENLVVGNPFPNGEGVKTLVDELYIYSRPLSKEEARNAYYRYVDPKKLRAIPSIDYETLTWPSKNRIRLTINGLAPKLRNDATVAEFAIFPEGGERPIHVEKIPKARWPVVWLKTPELPAGRYTTEVTVRNDRGTVLGKERGNSFIREHFPWENNRIGLNDRVIPPYPPLKTTTNSLIPWGREYTLGANGLPQQIKVINEPILTRASRLVARLGEKEVEVAGARLDVRSLSEARAGVTSAGTLDGIQARTSAEMEFDGWYQVKITLSCNRPVKVDSLDLVFDLWPAADTLYVQRDGDTRMGNKMGAIPAGSGVVWDSTMLEPCDNSALDDRRWKSFAPIVFVGTGDKGLWWFAETDDGWENCADSPCVQIEREPGKTVRLRFRLFGQPVTLQRPRTVEFAILASPVKPLPDNWRKIAWGYPEEQYVHETYGFRFYGDSVDGFALHTEEDYRKLREFFQHPLSVNSYFLLGGNDGHVRAWDTHWSPGVRAGKPVVLYGSGQMTGCGMPEFNTYAGEWLGDNNWIRRPDMSFKGLGNYGGTIKWESPEQLTAAGVNFCQSFVDCFVWYHQQLVEKCGINGTWWDNQSIFTVSEFDETKAEIVTKWNPFMRRQLNKRLAVMAWEAGRQPFWLMNMHTDFSWCPVAWHVENDFGMAATPGTTLLDNLNVDEFRALTRVKGGVIPRLCSLIYNTPEWKEDQLLAAARTLMGLCLLHDIGDAGLPHGGTEKLTLTAKVLRMLAEKIDFFGEPGPEFLPYWRQRVAVTLPEGVRLSAYRGVSPSTNRPVALLVLLNTSKEEISIADLRICPADLGIRPISKVYEPESGMELHFEPEGANGCLRWAEAHAEKATIKKHDFKLLIIE